MKDFKALLRQYYVLTKPGIIRGNLLTAIGGFGLASTDRFELHTLVFLLIGMALVIGASCVFNNIIDRGIDSKMERTKNRALVDGSISPTAALAYGSLLAILGFVSLLYGTNLLTTLLGLFGLVAYVGIYTPAKHRTPYATLLGTIPGAIPPVAGYTAITDHLDVAAGLLFVILVCWQMPHFYAIAIRRLNEYKAAKVPIWPIAKDINSTKWQMVGFGLLFIVFCLQLSATGYASPVFGLVMSVVGAYWTYVCWGGLETTHNKDWAKKVFLLSLPILPLFSLLLVLNQWLV
jgi:protoheme IX farnesyltransferase